MRGKTYLNGASFSWTTSTSNVSSTKLSVYSGKSVCLELQEVCSKRNLLHKTGRHVSSTVAKLSKFHFSRSTLRQTFLIFALVCIETTLHTQTKKCMKHRIKRQVQMGIYFSKVSWHIVSDKLLDLGLPILSFNQVTPNYHWAPASHHVARTAGSPDLYQYWTSTNVTLGTAYLSILLPVQSHMRPMRSPHWPNIWAANARFPPCRSSSTFLPDRLSKTRVRLTLHLCVEKWKGVSRLAAHIGWNTRENAHTTNVVSAKPPAVCPAPLFSSIAPNHFKRTNNVYTNGSLGGS